MKKITRILSALLVICMVFSIVPVMHTQNASAAGIYDGWLWPVPSNITMSRAYWGVSSDYGHMGIDIKPSAGGQADNVEVVAAKGGTVVLVFGGCNSWNGLNNSHKNCAPWAQKWVNGKAYNKTLRSICNYGFGRGVIIDHGNGVISTYAHLNSTTVSAGQKIEQGDRIGYMGSYGASTGKHLHFDIWENQWNWLASTSDFYPNGKPINNNPIGNEYLIIDFPDQWNGVDTILYSRNYHKHTFDAKTHVCACGDWDPSSLKSVNNNVKGTLKVTKSGGAVKRSGPYQSCKSFAVGYKTELTYVGTVVNAEDNTWYKLSDGNYIFKDNVEIKSEPAPSKLTLSASLSASEMTEYEGNKIVGNFSSNYNMTVTAYLDNVKKSSISVKSGAYTISASHAMNKAIDWGALAPGKHTIKIVITDEGGGSKTAELGLTVTAIITKPAVSSVENFIGGKKVSLKCDTYGAKIYYTTDGSTPTQASKQYEGPFNITDSCTVKAVSTNGIQFVSGVMSYDVVVSEAAVPHITYDHTQWGTRVTISADANCEIMYSVDNGVYSKYFEPFIISNNASVSAYVRSNGCKNSQTVTENITVSAPEAPKLNPAVAAKVAQNGTVTVTWNTVKNAASYTVTVTKDGEAWKSETVSAANASFILDEAGVYSFTVTASNAIGESEASAPVAIEAVSPRTVTFVDWDGSVISEQKVDYGAAATLPEEPSRTGYYFTGWAGNYSDVRSDITVTANYRIKTFSVVFLNVDGSKI
ncbi:MAG: peptidoglycan DD-metalloendopeptidase family protein, partial [Oscillospiraceae bacterium]|nr:peptidoglycan DD-metalloendopeptidase family protein [Oscillospiraceae bacterium]